MGGRLWGQEGNTVSNVIMIHSVRTRNWRSRSFWPDRYSQKGPRGRLSQDLQMLLRKETEIQRSKMQRDRNMNEGGMKGNEIAPLWEKRRKTEETKDEHIHSKERFLGPKTMIRPTPWSTVAQTLLAYLWILKGELLLILYLQPLHLCMLGLFHRLNLN